MQNQYNEKLIERIDASQLRDHPLMKACRRAFSRYLEEMDHPVLTPEHMFYEAAFLLDDILEDPNPAPEWLEGRWTTLVRRQRILTPTATPKELYKSTAAIYLTTAVVLSLHRESLYNDILHEPLIETVEKKMRQLQQSPDDRSVAQAEWHRVVCDLSTDAQSLDEWSNDYIDAPGEWISDVVQRVVDGGPYLLTVAPKPRPVRQPKDPQKINDSFTYSAKGVEDKALRLQLFYESLLGRYIDKDTDQKEFVDMFLGKTTTYKVVWIGAIMELKYLFEKLFDGLVTHKYSKWIAVCARFRYRAKLQDADSDATQNLTKYEDIDLTPANFNTHAPKKHHKLDRIIKILDPKAKAQTAYDDFCDYWDEQTMNDESLNKNFAVANGLRESSHPY